MDNKRIGIIILIVSIALIILLLYLVYPAYKSIKSEIDTSGGLCVHEKEECPHEKLNDLLIPVYIIMTIIIFTVIFSIYLIFFEKSSKKYEKLEKNLEEEKEKKVQEEKFNALLSGLDDDEKKIIKSIKEQDGISQATLRIRTDLSKPKLSLILSAFEKKDLVKKVKKGKTNLIFLKKKI